MGRVDGVRGCGHRTVAQATGSRNSVDGGGLSDRNRSCIPGGSGRGGAAVGGVVDGGTGSCIAQGDRLRARVGAPRGTESRRGRLGRVDRVGGGSHRTVAEAAGSRNCVDRRGLSHRDRSRIWSRARRGGAAVGGVVDGSTGSRIAQGD